MLWVAENTCDFISVLVVGTTSTACAWAYGRLRNVSCSCLTLYNDTSPAEHTLTQNADKIHIYHKRYSYILQLLTLKKDLKTVDSGIGMSGRLTHVIGTNTCACGHLMRGPHEMLEILWATKK